MTSRSKVWSPPNADKHQFIYGAQHKWVESKAISTLAVRLLREHLAGSHGYDYHEICTWSAEELSTAHMLAHNAQSSRPERTGFLP